MSHHATLRLFFCALIAAPLAAQSLPAAGAAAPGYDALAQSQGVTSNPLSQPTLTPGVLMLMELEGRFAKAVAEGGGKAFSSWFADDAIAVAAINTLRSITMMQPSLLSSK